MMFGNEVVVKDRVGIRLLGKGVGCVGGEWDREVAIGIDTNNFKRIDHIQE